MYTHKKDRHGNNVRKSMEEKVIRRSFCTDIEFKVFGLI